MDRKLWRRCRKLAGDLDLPEPFDPAEFVRGVAAGRGRPIELLPARVIGGPCGLVMSTDRADYILLPANTSALHRQHILLHEIGHLVCGHAGSVDVGALLPTLSPELVQRVLGRSVYTEVQEQEAELLATLVAHRAARGHEPEPAGDALVSRGLALVERWFG
ncbi:MULTISPECIES: hypothetical protein [Amycolatopsis]|uniref:IrrE N-terminal-like domain-containing protein n=1 Tax=Amycolatopsis albidoflavus TaxID=102226 RepID=A0ABW5I603_9PSEU